MAGTWMARISGRGKTSPPSVPVIAALLLPQARPDQGTTRMSPPTACVNIKREKNFTFFISR
jgi:hypothetical protein